jgi:hypothetical protein
MADHCTCAERIALDKMGLGYRQCDFCADQDNLAAARELLKADIAAAHAAGRREALTEVAEWCEGSIEQCEANGDGAGRYALESALYHARELAEKEGTEHA